MSAAKLRVVIVDDEPPARALLHEYLGADPEIEIVAECADGFEAVKRIAELAPDLVLLDVQMPKLDGFEVLELLDPGPHVIFVTAYDEYALRAFEVNAVDYLLKPVVRQRLVAAVERVRERGRGGTEMMTAVGGNPPAPSSVAAAARPPGTPLQRILVKDGAQVHVIPCDRVEMIEAQDDYVAIHTAGKTYLKTQSLSELFSALDGERFVRVHRSWVVNVECIARIEGAGKDARIAILKNGREVPVSRSGYARLRQRM
jgi:two-component system, LytTR family, response regulator